MKVPLIGKFHTVPTASLLCTARELSLSPSQRCRVWGVFPLNGLIPECLSSSACHAILAVHHGSYVQHTGFMSLRSHYTELQHHDG